MVIDQEMILTERPSRTVPFSSARSILSDCSRGLRHGLRNWSPLQQLASRERPCVRRWAASDRAAWTDAINEACVGWTQPAGALETLGSLAEQHKVPRAHNQGATRVCPRRSRATTSRVGSQKDDIRITVGGVAQPTFVMCANGSLT